MKPEAVKLSDQELEEMVLEALRKSERPLHAGNVVKELPRLYKVPEKRVLELLASLHQRGSVFPWGVSGKRTLYSAASIDQRVREGVLEVLPQPLSFAELKAKTKQRLTSKEAKKLVPNVIDDLLREGAIVKLPKVGERYALPERHLTLEEALRQFQHQFSHLSPDVIRESVLRALSPAQSLSERIQHAILAVEPRAKEGGLASIPEVRRHLSPPVSKKEFDAALLDLGRQGVLSIHVFYGHLQVGAQERAELVFDEKETYYGGVTFRRD